MAYGAFQTSVARLPALANGVVDSPQTCTINDKKVVETSAGIGLGVIVSCGTDPEKQVVLGVDTVPLGIVVRSGDVAGALGGESANTPVYAQNEVCPYIEDGEVAAYSASGSANAGSTTISVTDATGILKLGASAQAGESDVAGLTLLTTMTGAGVARFRIDKANFACTAYVAP